MSKVSINKPVARSNRARKISRVSALPTAAAWLRCVETCSEAEGSSLTVKREDGIQRFGALAASPSSVIVALPDGGEAASETL